MQDLHGRCVVLGITGGIAAYKMANVASALTQAGADVHVIMTKNAAEFITPLTFETLTHNPCVTDTFSRETPYEVTHISLAKAADLILIAPATANVIAKLAHGLADDMLTTTVLAASCPKFVAPAMNTAMLQNPVTQDNLKSLQKYGFEIISPENGYLACGDTGSGKLPSPEVLEEIVERELAREKTWKGKRVVVTAGPTQESMDPVRYITNHSTGKMGYAIAREAVLRGADVTVISGPVSLDPVAGARTVPVTTAEDMFRAVQAETAEADVLIMSAAVADYKPSDVADHKVKKSDADLSVPLTRTQDILSWVSDHKSDRLFVCGFSMETENLLENSRKKLEKKHLDLLVANSLREEGAGFAGDTNVVTFLSEDGTEQLPILQKSEVAAKLLDKITEVSR